MLYLSDKELEVVVGGLGVVITNTISGSSTVTGGNSDMGGVAALAGINTALTNIGGNPTPLTLAVPEIGLFIDARTAPNSPPHP